MSQDLKEKICELDYLEIKKKKKASSPWTKISKVWQWKPEENIIWNLLQMVNIPKE